MTEHLEGLERRLGELRRDFDRAFAEPRGGSEAPAIELLGIGVAGHAMALRLADVASVTIDRSIVWQPSAVAELLGSTAVRGVIVPVYDLGALMGFGRSAKPRFIAITRHREPLGLAFEALEGQVRVPAANIADTGADQLGLEFDATAVSRQVVHGVFGAPRPLISVAAAVAVIERKLDSTATRGATRHEE